MTARIRSVCLIHSDLGPAFERLGVTVTRLDPPAGETALATLLAGLDRPPDCVIQQEHLGKRLVLTGLDAAPCPTIFWARDPHLNFFWQRHYARLFSAVAVTQPHLVSAFRAAGARHVAWVTWPGASRPFVPHAARATALAFAGRVTSERPRRRWFVDHLAQSGLVFRDNVFGPALAAFYDAARIAPNETIAGEVNQRLFEAASSGCCVVTERTPEGVETLFVPGVEALFYDDVLELDAKLAWATRHPEQAEALGRAAWSAVADRHLPEHRAGQLLALAQEAGGPGVRGAAAAATSALVDHALVRAGQLPLAPDVLWQRLEAAPALPGIMAVRVAMAAEAGQLETVRTLASVCLVEPGLSGDLACAAACCLGAWRLGDAATAGRAYVAWCRGQGRSHAPRLTGLRDALLFFVREFEAASRAASPGLPFEPACHVPVDAAQCLMAVLCDRPDDLEAVRSLERLLRRLPGRQVERLGFLSTLTLHHPDDWTLGLELGLTDLRAFRRQAGLDELALAAATAERQGQATRFARRLTLADPSGRVRQTLGGNASGGEECLRRPGG